MASKNDPKDRTSVLDLDQIYENRLRRPDSPHKGIIMKSAPRSCIHVRPDGMAYSIDPSPRATQFGTPRVSPMHEPTQVVQTPIPEVPREILQQSHHRPQFSRHGSSSTNGDRQGYQNNGYNRDRDNRQRRDKKQYKLGEKVKVYSLKPGSHGKIIGKGEVAIVIRRNKYDRYFVQFKNGIVWDRVHVSRMRPLSYKDTHLETELAETVQMLEQSSSTGTLLTDAEAEDPVPPKPEPVDTKLDETVEGERESSGTHISIQESSDPTSPTDSSSKATPGDANGGECADINIIAEAEKLIHVQAGIYSTDQYTHVDLTETIKEEIVHNKYGTGMSDISNNGSCSFGKGDRNDQVPPHGPHHGQGYHQFHGHGGYHHGHRHHGHHPGPNMKKVQYELDKSYRRMENQVLKTLMWNEKANETFLQDMAQLVKSNQEDIRAHMKQSEDQTRVLAENRRLREEKHALYNKIKMLERERRSDHTRINELKQTIHLIGSSANVRASQTFMQMQTRRRSNDRADPVIWHQEGPNPPGQALNQRRVSKSSRHRGSQRVQWAQH